MLRSIAAPLRRELLFGGRVQSFWLAVEGVERGVDVPSPCTAAELSAAIVEAFDARDVWISGRYGALEPAARIRLPPPRRGGYPRGYMPPSGLTAHIVREDTQRPCLPSEPPL